MSGVTGDVTDRTSGVEERPPVRTRADRIPDLVRYVLIAGWLFAVVAVPAFGEREASWQDLRGLVATGQVQSVGVTDELLPGWTGFDSVQVHWQRGPLHYVTEVVQVRGRGQHPGQPGVVKVHDQPSQLLADLQPGLRVSNVANRTEADPTFGWRIPGALSMLTFVLLVAGFLLVIGGPEPWRATRWAWFWLFLPPVGNIVFLLVSGRLPGLPGPRNPSRRLTGGWAFLLSFPLASALGLHRF